MPVIIIPSTFSSKQQRLRCSMPALLHKKDVSNTLQRLSCILVGSTRRLPQRFTVKCMSQVLSKDHSVCLTNCSLSATLQEEPASLPHCGSGSYVPHGAVPQPAKGTSGAACPLPRCLNALS